jgi:hypothetical protein
MAGGTVDRHEFFICSDQLHNTGTDRKDKNG